MLDWVKTKLMSETDVKANLQVKLKTHFLTANTKLSEVKATFAIDKQLATLGKSCDALSKEAHELEKFILQDAQLNVMAKVFYTKAKEYASIDTLLDTLTKSPSVVAMKTALIDLISTKIFDGLVPLAQKLGEIEKLSLTQQLEIVKLLESDELKDKIAKIDIKKTFSTLKEKVEALAKELKLDPAQSDALKLIIATIETKHLKNLSKIKSDMVKHIDPLLKKLLEIVHQRCPHLASLETKVEPIRHTKATARKFGGKSKEVVAAKDDEVRKGKKAKK